MDGVKLDYQSAKNTLGEMQDVITKMDDELAEIKSLIAKLESSPDWVGQASDYYIDKTKNIHTIKENVWANLNKDMSYLSNAIESYKSADSDVSMNVPD